MLLSQLGFHRIHIPSLALPPPQPVEGFCLPFVGHFLHLRVRLSATAALRSTLSLRPAARSRLGIPSRLRRSGGRHRFSPPASSFIHARGNGGDAAIPKILPYPVGVNRPGASRPGTLHASLLPIACYCRGSSHRARVAVTVAAGERPPSYCQYRLPSVAARLDTWTRAARLSTLRPLPPTPPFPHALSRSDQWPQYVGGRGLRSPLKRATVSPNPFTEERRF